MAIQFRRRGKRGWRFGRDEKGVSAILGGLLFMAIVMVTMINFRVNIVPGLDEEREEKHMAIVKDRFAEVKGEADRMVDGRGRAPVSTAIPLKPMKEPGFFTDGTMASFLNFFPDERHVKLNTSELLVQTDNGTTVFGPQETWQTIVDGDVVDEIITVHHLRVRLEDPQAETEGDYLEVVVTDAFGNFAGDLRVYVDDHPSGYSLMTKVRDAEYDILFDQGESFFTQDQPPFYWVDALADEVQFSDVLGAAESPFKLTFHKSGMNGAFTIVYSEITELGEIVVGGAGKLYTDWQREEKGGLLSYRSQNVRYLRQDLYLESGGIIIDQPTGNTFLMEPAFDVYEDGPTLSVLRVTVPALTGRGEMHSGSEPVPVRVHAATNYAIVGTAPHLSYNVSTEHPQVWSAFWKTKFETAGFTEAQGNFSLATGDDWARFDFWGTTTAPASTTHDLAVVIRSGQVEVVMRD